MKQARSNKSRNFARRRSAAIPVGKWLLPLLLVVLVVTLVMVFLFLRQETEHPLEQPVYQYFQLSRSDYSENATVSRSEYNIILKDGDTQNGGDVTPLYFRDEPAFLLAEDMAWTSPTATAEWTIPAFSRIYRDSSGILWCEIDGKLATLEGGILSNGRGTYVVLEDMTLQFNGRLRDLPAYSFWSNSYGMNRVYFYSDDNIQAIEELEGSVTVSVAGYTIDLTAGIIRDASGNFRLLSSNPGKLPLITLR